MPAACAVTTGAARAAATAAARAFCAVTLAASTCMAAFAHQFFHIIGTTVRAFGICLGKDKFLKFTSAFAAAILINRHAILLAKEPKAQGKKANSFKERHLSGKRRTAFVGSYACKNFRTKNLERKRTLRHEQRCSDTQTRFQSREVPRDFDACPILDAQSCHIFKKIVIHKLTVKMFAG